MNTNGGGIPLYAKISSSDIDSDFINYLVRQENAGRITKMNPAEELEFKREVFRKAVIQGRPDLAAEIKTIEKKILLG